MRGCLFGCLTLLTPRVVIVLLVVLTDYLGRAYETVIWPLLGFVFLPITTLAYAVATNELRSGSALWWAVVIAAVLADLGFLGGGSWGTRGLRGKWRAKWRGRRSKRR